MYTIRFGSACTTFGIFTSNTAPLNVIAKQRIVGRKADGLLGWFGFEDGAEHVLDIEVQWEGKNRIDMISFNVGTDQTLISEMLEMIQQQAMKKFQSVFIECECNPRPRPNHDAQTQTPRDAETDSESESGSEAECGCECETGSECECGSECGCDCCVEEVPASAPPPSRTDTVTEAVATCLVK